MAYDLEEQEQIADLKAWWDKYGNFVFTIATVALLAVAAWNGWNWYQRKQSVEAAAVYEELLKAVRKVASGRRYLPRSLAEKLAWRFSVGNDKDGHEALSDRELQVLCMLASGRRLSDVASELGLSIKTVSTYRARILSKMGMNTTAELIQYAIRNGLVQ